MTCALVGTEDMESLPAGYDDCAHCEAWAPLAEGETLCNDCLASGVEL